MFIQMLSTTTGFTVEKGKMVDVPKRVVTQLGTIGCRKLDGRYSITTAHKKATEMMKQQNNKVGYALYGGSISCPRLIDSYITDEYKNLQQDLQNG